MKETNFIWKVLGKLHNSEISKNEKEKKNISLKFLYNWFLQLRSKKKKSWEVFLIKLIWHINEEEILEFESCHVEAP